MSPSPSQSNIDSLRTLRPSIRVLLVDDHPAVRLGACSLIDEQPDVTVVAEASSVTETLSKLDAPIDVAVIDYQLGGGHDGLSLTMHLKRLELPPRVLVYSAFADSALAVSAIIAGADGLLGKQALGEELCTAIRRLASGRHYLPAVTVSVANAMSARLEPDDHAIFGMLLHGLDAGAVAERLGLSAEQLNRRRARILDSLKRAPLGFLTGARAPLDYERPRRTSRWAA